MAQQSGPKASNWKYNALPPAKAVVQQPQAASNHLSRKRSYDSSGAQQNGMDGTLAKTNSVMQALKVVLHWSTCNDTMLREKSF